ncbi:MAG: hypothetical protein ACRBBR_04645 [Cellvibrionaceae bacterium]
MRTSTLLPFFLLSMIGAGLVNPAFAGSPSHYTKNENIAEKKKPLQHQVKRFPRGSSTFGVQSQGRQGLVHDSDKQLDVWVARCNKAGGGMILRDDGNYDCVGPHGYPIPW